jgi:hypothetical protein
MKSFSEKSKIILPVNIFLMVFFLTVSFTKISAQTVLFDFDNAPLYTSLPINLTVGGITAHLSATSQGFSIQNANAIGFVPQGFSGRIIYPNSINLSDLIISYDKTLTDFSIMYCCQELGCDDAARMRVTAYMNGSYVGTNTKTAANPGTWPVDTLRCSFPQGFNSVVVHYDARPPTCSDYGTIYMADNMVVTAVSNLMTLNQIAFIQGFYNSAINSMVADTLTVYLRNASSPYAIVDFANAIVNSVGHGTFLFSNVSNGVNYYIQLNHRNSIETWSKTPQQFTAGTLNYDFTNIAAKAFGDNLIQIDISPVKFAIYNGDVNQDGIIDGSDISMADNDALNTVFGYVPTDVTGDDFVDAADVSIIDNNAFHSVTIISP